MVEGVGDLASSDGVSGVACLDVACVTVVVHGSVVVFGGSVLVGRWREVGCCVNGARFPEASLGFQSLYDYFGGGCV